MRKVVVSKFVREQGKSKLDFFSSAIDQQLASCRRSHLFINIIFFVILSGGCGCCLAFRGLKYHSRIYKNVCKMFYFCSWLYVLISLESSCIWSLIGFRVRFWCDVRLSHISDRRIEIRTLVIMINGSYFQKAKL